MIVNNKMAFFSDSLGHSALTGIAIGMLLGIIFVFRALAGGIYIAVTVVKPKDIAPETSNFLGDLANMSLWDMAKNLSDLYKNKIGVADENGRYYSLGEFLAEYKIDSKTAFGMDLPEEVLDIPAFEFFNSSDGVNNAMKQIKVSALPAIVNMFGSKGENENADAAFNAATIEELSNYSLYELLKDESKGIAYVFQNVKFADVLKDSFPSEDSDNKLMWAVGQAYVGKLLSGMSGENNILGQLKTGGAFEALGKLPVIQIIGESQYVKAILGDILTADLVDENGELKEGISTFKLPVDVEGTATGENDYYANCGIGTAVLKESMTPAMKDFIAYIWDNYADTAMYEFNMLPSMMPSNPEQLPGLTQQILSDLEACGTFAQCWDVRLDPSTNEVYRKELASLGMMESTPEEFCENMDKAVAQYAADYFDTAE